MASITDQSVASDPFQPNNNGERVGSPLQGIRAGAVLRPEPLFHRRTRLIIDTHYNSEHNLLCNGMEEIDFQNLKLISLDKLFDNKHEIFLGFGLPNVYLTVPNHDSTGYVKFAAFILWRQTSAVIDTKGRVQSGFMIRIRQYPDDLLTMLRKAMGENSNRRHVSCAYANACVLNAASITSGGMDLRSHFGARALFQHIYEHGLEFRGIPLILDFIRTTPRSLEEHFHEVRKKELTSLGRTYRKIIHECHTSSDKIRAPLIEVNDVPVKPIVNENVKCLIGLEISRPRMFGALIRKIFGSHTLFKIIPNRECVDINDFLPTTLRAFPQQHPDLFTRMKKSFLFSKPVVVTIRKHLAALWDDHGQFSVGPLAAMMSIDKKDEPHVYNIVITGNHIVGMHSNPFLNLKVVDWLLSKHVLISGYDDDVRFAGEAWMEHRDNGLILHLTNNSGTYKPSNEQLSAAGQFITSTLPGLQIELHSNPPVPSNDTSVFPFTNIIILILAMLFWLSMVIFGHPHDIE